MKQQFIKFFFFFCLKILLVACNPATPTPVVILPTPTVTAPTIIPPPPIPSPSATLSPQPTAISTSIASPSSVATRISGTTQIPVMPGAILDEASTGWGMTLSQFLGQEVVSYNTSTSLEAIRDFYQDEMANQGWEWIFTDMGESLALSRPIPILVQEFKHGANRLAVVAIEGFGFRNNTPAILVLSGTNVSSGELITFFRSLIAGGLDLGPPNEGDVRPQAMRFTSPLLQFDHPSNWFPTQLQMSGFQTDTQGSTTNIFPEPRYCAYDNETCFVNFAFLTGSLFEVPVMVRVYPSQAETTLDTFDAQRWARLVATAENPPTSLNNVERPEDMIDKGSLETIETKPITFKDGTPALQRVYRWRQVGLSIPLVSSYILFKHKDTIIEFHTDLTEEEWTSLGPAVQQVISGIELTP